jgi:hypothetical protein
MFPAADTSYLMLKITAQGCELEYSGSRYAVVNTAMNFSVKCEHFLTRQVTDIFSRRSLLHAVR